MPMKFPALSKLPKVTLPRKFPAVPPLPGRPAAVTLQGTSAAARSADNPATSSFTGRSVWRTLLAPLRAINWRILAAALFAIGILHIVATLAAPSLALSTAYDRLDAILPSNRVVILPPVSPQAQPLPFMSPALRYALCRYDTSSGPVDVSVELSETGSSLTIYTVDGEAVYTAAQSEVPLHRVRIIPNDGRFLGLTPEARGRRSTEVPSATLPADRGIVVYAIPDLGVSYRSATERQLAAVSCKPSTAE